MNQRAGAEPSPLMCLLVCREAGRRSGVPGDKETESPLTPALSRKGRGSPLPRKVKQAERRKKGGVPGGPGHAPEINRSPDYSALDASTGGGSTLLRRPRKGCTPNSASFSESMP